MIVPNSLIGKTGYLTHRISFLTFLGRQFLFKDLFCCKYVLYHVHAYYPQRPEEVVIPLELELVVTTIT